MPASRESFKKLSKANLRTGLFALSMLAMAALGSHPILKTMFGSFDKVTFDLVSQRFAHPSSRTVAIVEIDEKTMRELGPVNLPRYGAALMDELGQAASVTLDVMVPLYMAAADSKGRAQRKHLVLPLPAVGADALRGAALPHWLKNTASVGHRDVTVGHFGAVSGIVPFRQVGAQVYPHVALEAIRLGSARLARALSDYMQPRALSVGRETTPSILLMMPRLSDIAHYSFADVVKGRVPASAFAQKLVFVGASGASAESSWQISSLNMDAVTPSQLDGLMTEAIVDGNVIREVPGKTAMQVYMAIALGMILICALTPGARMHAFAFGWLAAAFAGSTALLGGFHIWLPLGVLPFVCLLIYAFYAWQRIVATQRVLRSEIHGFTELSSRVGAPGALDLPGDEAALAAPPLEQIGSAMRQIRAWQEAYVSVINQLPHPIFVTKGGQLAIWNDRAAALLDTAPDGSAPVAPAWLGDALAGPLPAGGADREIELDGRIYTLLSVQLASFAQVSADDADTQLICLVDISDVKESVLQDRQTLRHMAHDLRNPLTTVLALIEQKRAGPAAFDEPFIGTVRRLVDYSLRITQDFVQLAHAEHLDADAFEPVSVDELADEALDQIWASADMKAIRIAGPGEQSGAIVLGNRDMLLRSLVNLLDNAVKYSPPGSAVALRINAASRQDGRVALHVVDEGIGIGPDALPRLFEPFFQVKEACDAGSGVGLGLPFVKAVVERHRGAVGVASELGKGSDIWIDLPAAA
ncbi:ATP-binding protein [Trinickia mobilis]|uniref:ATP-binding protein n=1 Tax=Trinickia mobilis TaxID=2816356 RepID=UPI001A8EB453|nr:ATP-binding protein [Trinickia mobilis]